MRDPFDRQPPSSRPISRPIRSPALVPGPNDAERANQGGLVIGLVNNMPDSALKATERQFMRLVQAAAGKTPVRFHCFSLPSIIRSKQAKEHIDKGYQDIARLDRLHIDGLIVTGAEPVAPEISKEPYWRELSGLIDWAKTNTRSAIWSCLAAHAAVLHLDGIERKRLPQKCSGVYDCVKVTRDWATSDLPSSIKVSHSRLNEVRQDDLVSRNYSILTCSNEAGVDIFARDFESRFIFFQGHPEYDALSLQREFMRDVARYLSGERQDYPALPASYFDAETEETLANFAARVRLVRRPELAAELPGLTLRPNVPAGGAATTIFGNWIDFLNEDARALPPESVRK
jgi:homoserine O-succinyltransferase